MLERKKLSRIQYVFIFFICLAFLILYLDTTRVNDNEGKVYDGESLENFRNDSSYAVTESLGRNNSTELIKTLEGENKTYNEANPIIKIFRYKHFPKTIVNGIDVNERTTNNKYTFSQLNDIERSASNIFFIETKCSTAKMAKVFNASKVFLLNARQCCAVESTALANLDRPVYVFHSCPLDDYFLERTPKYAERLLRYPNVRVVRTNHSELFADSPVEELLQGGRLEESSYPIEHASDVLRLLLLWRFGGTYSDLDVVTIKSFYKLGTNWAGMQDADYVANGVLSFAPDGEGHELLQEALQILAKEFDGSQWGGNGPSLITRVILRACNASSVSDATARCEGNFTVLETPVLYPVYYPSAEEFFKEDGGQELVDRVKGSSYSVHIWGKMSRDKPARVGSAQAYALLAQQFCPEAYRYSGEYF